MPSSAGAAKPAAARKRTPRQQERKRALDRALQQQNRARHKEFVQQLHEELGNARKEIEHLNSVIEALQSPVQLAATNGVLPTTSSDCPCQYNDYPIPVSTPVSYCLHSPGLQQMSNMSHPSRLDLPLTPGSEVLEVRRRDRDSMQMSFLTATAEQTKVGRNFQRPDSQFSGDSRLLDDGVPPHPDIRPFTLDFSQRSTKNIGKGGSQTLSGKPSNQARELVQRLEEPPPELDCRCEPKKHKSYFECFERTVFNALMQMHAEPTAPLSIPVQPELADVLLMRQPQNPVSMVVYKMLRKPNVGLVIRSAVYILLHRVLRYRFLPSLQTFNDVPEWLRPTETQDSTPHQLYMDFVQFPKLRDAMVQGLVNIDNIRDEFDADFGRHISVNWPDSNSLLVVNESYDTVMNPDFEHHVCDLDNWTLDSGFAVKYPDMAHLVVIRDLAD